MIEVPERFLEERRLAGDDRWDEMWEGVLHMVPPPSDRHQALGTYLVAALVPVAQRLGLEVRYESGFYRADDDYRQPDLLFAKVEHFTHRGLEGPAELVVEILSPGDESYGKLDFYASMSVREVLLIDPFTREFELMRLGDGDTYERVAIDQTGEVRCDTLEITLSVVNGPLLRIKRGEYLADV